MTMYKYVDIKNLTMDKAFELFQQHGHFDLFIQRIALKMKF